MTSSTKEEVMDTKKSVNQKSNTREPPMDTMADFDIGHDEMLDLGGEDVVMSNLDKISSSGITENDAFPEVMSRLHAKLQGGSSDQPMLPTSTFAFKSSTNTKPLPSSRASEAKAAGRHMHQGDAVGGSF